MKTINVIVNDHAITISPLTLLPRLLHEVEAEHVVPPHAHGLHVEVGQADLGGPEAVLALIRGQHRPDGDLQRLGGQLGQRYRQGEGLAEGGRLGAATAAAVAAVAAVSHDDSSGAECPSGGGGEMGKQRGFDAAGGDNAIEMVVLREFSQKQYHARLGFVIKRANEFNRKRSQSKIQNITD